MAQQVATTAVFEEIFKNPSIKGMLDLSWSQFEDFVDYVFSCAGYTVVKVASQPQKHVDLELYQGHVGAKPVAKVEVRRYENAHIIKGRVLQFLGALQIGGGVRGYIVTTSDFTGPAYAAAHNTNGKVQLINGHRLLRYVNYVRGSRLTGDAVPLSQGKTLLDPISPTVMVEADTIRRRNPSLSAVLAIVNNKGGVGKTTTALNFALALATSNKHKVLLIDMDGQTSLTRALPAPTNAPMLDGQKTLADFFSQRATLKEILRPTRFEGVWLIPGHEKLILIDRGGGAHPESELAFSRAIHDDELATPKGELFDWIILDTPPAQSTYTRAAVGAAHYVLIPTNAETFAVLGASRALSTTRTMGALMGGGVTVVGAAVTHWRKTPAAQKALSDLTDLMAAEGTRVFSQYIDQDDRVEKAIVQTVGGKVNHLFKLGNGNGPAAKRYLTLVKEMMMYVNGGY